MKDNQQEQLFAELTPAEAAVVSGGDTRIDITLDFDFALDSRKFAVTEGDAEVTLSIGSLTSKGDDGVFTAALKRVRSGGTTTTVAKSNFSSGSSTNFGRQAAGNYLIQFTDKKDNKRVVGPASIIVA